MIKYFTGRKAALWASIAVLVCLLAGIAGGLQAKKQQENGIWGIIAIDNSGSQVAGKYASEEQVQRFEEELQRVKSNSKNVVRIGEDDSVIPGRTRDQDCTYLLEVQYKPAKYLYVFVYGEDGERTELWWDGVRYQLQDAKFLDFIMSYFHGELRSDRSEPETISYSYQHSSIQFTLPAGWEYMICEPGEDEWKDPDRYSIFCWPQENPEIIVEVASPNKLFFEDLMGISVSEFELENGATGNCYLERFENSFSYLYHFVETPGEYFVHYTIPYKLQKDYNSVIQQILESAVFGEGECPRKEAIAIAKKECNFLYLYSNEQFDRATGNWEISFRGYDGDWKLTVTVGKNGKVLKTEGDPGTAKPVTYSYKHSNVSFYLPEGWTYTVDHPEEPTGLSGTYYTIRCTSEEHPGVELNVKSSWRYALIDTMGMFVEKFSLKNGMSGVSYEQWMPPIYWMEYVVGSSAGAYSVELIIPESQKGELDDYKDFVQSILLSADFGVGELSYDEAKAIAEQECSFVCARTSASFDGENGEWYFDFSDEEHEKSASVKLNSKGKVLSVVEE